MTWQTVSRNLNDTLRLGEAVGKNLKGGEVIELVSDLGGGKTSFVRGLAQGMGSDDQVASPTFTISRVYKAGKKLELHHYDFYRLSEAGVVESELAESTADRKVVVAVEWANVVDGVLPDDRLSVTMTPRSARERVITFHAGPKHNHLLKGLE